MVMPALFGGFSNSRLLLNVTTFEDVAGCDEAKVRALLLP